jgi:hypothetical protein
LEGCCDELSVELPDVGGLGLRGIEEILGHMNKMPRINKEILLNREIAEFIIKFFPGYGLNSGFIVLLRYKINLFHDFFICPLTFLHWYVLDVVLVFDVFACVGLVGFASLGLEGGGFGNRFINHKFVLDLVAAGNIRVAQLGGEFGSDALPINVGKTVLIDDGKTVLTAVVTATSALRVVLLLLVPTTRLARITITRPCISLILSAIIVFTTSTTILVVVIIVVVIIGVGIIRPVTVSYRRVLDDWRCVVILVLWDKGWVHICL